MESNYGDDTSLDRAEWFSSLAKSDREDSTRGLYRLIDKQNKLIENQNTIIENQGKQQIKLLERMLHRLLNKY